MRRLLRRLVCWWRGHEPTTSIYREVLTSRFTTAGDLVWSDDRVLKSGQPFQLCSRCGGRVDVQRFFTRVEEMRHVREKGDA